jgi:hypothetical protein
VVVEFVTVCISPRLFKIFRFRQKFFPCFLFKVLLSVKQQRNILHEISIRKANWVGNMLHPRQVIEGKIKGGIEVTGRRGRRRRKQLDDFKERREYSHLKEVALDRTVWTARFRRGFRPIVRQSTKCPF